MPGPVSEIHMQHADFFFYGKRNTTRGGKLYGIFYKVVQNLPYPLNITPNPNWPFSILVFDGQPLFLSHRRELRPMSSMSWRRSIGSTTKLNCPVSSADISMRSSIKRTIPRLAVRMALNCLATDRRIGAVLHQINASRNDTERRSHFMREICNEPVFGVLCISGILVRKWFAVQLFQQLSGNVLKQLC